MFIRIYVSGGIGSLYCGLTNPLALKKLFGSEALGDVRIWAKHPKIAQREALRHPGVLA
jgi:hypothetical protein